MAGVTCVPIFSSEGQRSCGWSHNMLALGWRTCLRQCLWSIL